MKINRQTLSEQIYTILKMEILKGEIKFGFKLSNRALQKRFEVSSSPIRDAINRLNQDGLISSIDNTGATVISFDYDFFQEVNEVLLHIVNAGVKLSYDKGESHRIYPNLLHYLELQEKNIDNDKYYEYDYKFHKTFLDYSSNSRLKKLFKEYNVLHEILVRNFHELKTPETRARSIAEHKQIIETVRSKDFRFTMKCTELHYKHAETIFREILSKKDFELEKLTSVDE